MNSTQPELSVGMSYSYRNKHKCVTNSLSVAAVLGERNAMVVIYDPGHGAAMADTLHRFEVRDCHLMNEALAKWSLTIEKEDDENVQKSNWGG